MSARRTISGRVVRWAQCIERKRDDCRVLIGRHDRKRRRRIRLRAMSAREAEHRALQVTA